MVSAFILAAYQSTGINMDVVSTPVDVSNMAKTWWFKPPEITQPGGKNGRGKVSAGE
jgi:hypothetical protein